MRVYTPITTFDWIMYSSRVFLFFFLLVKFDVYDEKMQKSEIENKDNQRARPTVVLRTPCRRSWFDGFPYYHYASCHMPSKLFSPILWIYEFISWQGFKFELYVRIEVTRIMYSRDIYLQFPYFKMYDFNLTIFWNSIFSIHYALILFPWGTFPSWSVK